MRTALLDLMEYEEENFDTINNALQNSGGAATGYLFPRRISSLGSEVARLIVALAEPPRPVRRRYKQQLPAAM